MAEEPVVHILWLNSGLGCDGDSVALTAAMQPSIEDIVMGTLPGLPRMAVHWLFIDYQVGDEFMQWFWKADRGEIDPFVLVVEGSIPNEEIKREGYWAAMGNRVEGGGRDTQPMTTSEWLDRLASKAWAVLAVGTCATYGGIHAMAGNPTGAMGVPDFLGWDFRSKAGNPIVCVPGCPIHPDNLSETILYLLYQAASGRRRRSRLMKRCGHPGCSAPRSTKDATGPATTSRATSRPNMARINVSSNSAAGARW